MRAEISIPRFLIAATHSGAGKTTISMGLAATLGKERSVACFKVGPDYIDPGYLQAGSGAPAANLDGWLLAPAQVKEVFCRRSRGADIAVVEGVMGLFDGRGSGEEGSSAQMADLLKLPVILVIDASGAARSVAATAAGFRDFDPRIKVAGVILNRVGSPRHLRAAAGPIEKDAGLPVVGYLEKDAAFEAPSRHLGLVQRPAAELEDLAAVVGERLAANVDLERLLDIATAAPRVEFESRDPEESATRSVRIGVARDDAFSFYYQENLDLLERFGAEIISFSPLADVSVPENIDGLYFGGGWPELHAGTLGRNTAIRDEVRELGRAGLPIYAECGGLVYLTDELHCGGQSWPMAGVVPAEAYMTDRRQGLGYREARFTCPTILGDEGVSVRGHEFHWTMIEKRPDYNYRDAYLYDDGTREGFASDNVLASYLHLNWLGGPNLARAFIDNCYRRKHA